MARTKKSKDLAPRGTTAGMVAIRIWAMQIEARMMTRYVGNAPTLARIRKVAARTLRDLDAIKPALMSDCDPEMTHQPNCYCNPSI